MIVKQHTFLESGWIQCASNSNLKEIIILLKMHLVKLQFCRGFNGLVATSKTRLLWQWVLCFPCCLATQVIASAHPFGGLAHSAPEFALHRSAMGPKSWLVNWLVSCLGVVCNIAVWLFGMFNMFAQSKNLKNLPLSSWQFRWVKCGKSFHMLSILQIPQQPTGTKIEALERFPRFSRLADSQKFLPNSLEMFLFQMLGCYVVGCPQFREVTGSGFYQQQTPLDKWNQIWKFC